MSQRAALNERLSQPGVCSVFREQFVFVALQKSDGGSNKALVSAEI